MPEIATKQAGKRKNQEEIIKILADKYDVEPRYVNMVISGDRNHDEILADYITYSQEHNLLLEKVKELVPFNS